MTSAQTGNWVVVDHLLFLWRVNLNLSILQYMKILEERRDLRLTAAVSPNVVDFSDL